MQAPLRRTSSSPNTTPESEGTLQSQSPSDSATSPEVERLSPRISPRSQGGQGASSLSAAANHTYARTRVQSGRLGSSVSNGGPVRGRKIAPAQGVADVINEEATEEQRAAMMEREEEADRDWKAMVLGRSLEREREEEQAREREQESDVDRELEKEREMMERERARNNQDAMQQSKRQKRFSLTGSLTLPRVSRRF